jgi:hypothetical protein
MLPIEFFVGRVGPVNIKAGVQIEVDWRDNVIALFAAHDSGVSSNSAPPSVRLGLRRSDRRAVRPRFRRARRSRAAGKTPGTFSPIWAAST